MNIRTANDQDIAQIKDLFQQTILFVNTKDYSLEQASCWADKGNDENVWKERIAGQYFIVGEHEGIITGFAALKTDGYLNSLFVHKDFQGKGVATALLNHIEEYARQKKLHEITADVSVTAKPFFVRKGYEVLKEQTVCLDNVEMINYKMRKSLILF